MKRIVEYLLTVAPKSSSSGVGCCADCLMVAAGNQTDGWTDGSETTKCLDAHLLSMKSDVTLWDPVRLRQS